MVNGNIGTDQNIVAPMSRIRIRCEERAVPFRAESILLHHETLVVIGLGR